MNAWPRVGLIALLCLTGALSARCEALRTIDSPHYTLKTDVSPEVAREAVVRMTKMAEEYESRTRSLRTRAPTKLPFTLYHDASDYFATGAPKASAGVFTGSALLAVAPAGGDWHVVQHEGFHQFAAAAMGEKLPVWLDEGLAEYFGECLFTGDAYTSGLIPDWRLKRLQRELRDNRLRPLGGLMALSPEQWNERLAICDYDQAWSLVQFLAHANGGQYQPAFDAFLKALAQGAVPADAWQKHLGDVAPIEAKWRDYWSNLPPNPTADVYARSALTTVASFLARAESAGQQFANFDDYDREAKARRLRISETEWLPPSLLTDALSALHDMHAELSLQREQGDASALRARWPGGMSAVARYSRGLGRQVGVIVSGD